MTHDELERLVEYGQQLASERGLSGDPAALGDILRDVVRRAVSLEARRFVVLRASEASDGTHEQQAHALTTRGWL